MASRNPSSEHDNIDSDPGPMYHKPWVQELIKQIQQFLQTSCEWLDIDQSKPQRVLDYACGNGTVSGALLASFPNATFHGLDIATSQVKRFNEEATRLSGGSHPRMQAIQGDLNDPQHPLDQPEWNDFDTVIISMALHHVKDPPDLLARLHQRVRHGGSIVVIDWLQQSDIPAETDSADVGIASERMTRLSEGPNIWPGFSLEDIRAHLHAAGCIDVDIKVYSEHIEAPKEMEGYSRMFIAKAKVPLSD